MSSSKIPKPSIPSASKRAPSSTPVLSVVQSAKQAVTRDGPRETTPGKSASCAGSRSSRPSFDRAEIEESMAKSRSSLAGARHRAALANPIPIDAEPGSEARRSLSRMRQLARLQTDERLGREEETPEQHRQRRLYGPR